MANRNRSAGHKFERLILNELKELGYEKIYTSRSESRNMDANKVDIVGDFPYHVQCKSSTTRPDYHSILNMMPEDKPCIIIHRQTYKAGSRFMVDGDYVIMKKEDFYNMIRR